MDESCCPKQIWKSKKAISCPQLEWELQKIIVLRFVFPQPWIFVTDFDGVSRMKFCSRCGKNMIFFIPTGGALMDHTILQVRHWKTQHFFCIPYKRGCSKKAETLPRFPGSTVVFVSLHHRDVIATNFLIASSRGQVGACHSSWWGLGMTWSLLFWWRKRCQISTIEKDDVSAKIGRVTYQLAGVGQPKPIGAASLCFVSPFFVWYGSSTQAQHNVNDKFLFLEWDCMIENNVKSEKVWFRTQCEANSSSGVFFQRLKHDTKLTKRGQRQATAA